MSNSLVVLESHSSKISTTQLYGHEMLWPVIIFQVRKFD